MATSTLTTITVKLAEWQRDKALIAPVREQVFIEEQQVSVELEWDELDEVCIHLLALDGDQPIGTARMTLEGKIGRMAVLTLWRKKGVGSQLLEKMIAVARDRGLAKVVLDAQEQVILFYQRFGFEVISESFLDAGILHRRMSLQL